MHVRAHVLDASKTNVVHVRAPVLDAIAEHIRAHDPDPCAVQVSARSVDATACFSNRHRSPSAQTAMIVKASAVHVHAHVSDAYISHWNLCQQ